MSEKKIFFATKALIIKNKKFLGVHKSNVNHSLYELPGGRLEFGESAEETLLREIKEETNLTVEYFNILDTWNYISGEYHTVGIIYLCQIKDGTIILSNEHDKYEWLPLNRNSIDLMYDAFRERMLKWDINSIISISSDF